MHTPPVQLLFLERCPVPRPSTPDSVEGNLSGFSNPSEKVGAPPPFFPSEPQPLEPAQSSAFAATPVIG